MFLMIEPEARADTTRDGENVRVTMGVAGAYPVGRVIEKSLVLCFNKDRGRN